MATPYPSTVFGELDRLTPEEIERLEKRRKDVKNYLPPKWRSNSADDVSGQPIEQAMVDHASILNCSHNKLLSDIAFRMGVCMHVYKTHLHAHVPI